MRNHHYGSAFRVVNSRKKLHDAVRGLVVEITGRLISDDYTGLIQQRSCNGDSLLLSAGKLVWHLMRLGCHADIVEDLGDSLGDGIPIFPSGGLEYKFQVFFYGSVHK